jgi:hypothetical protein
MNLIIILSPRQYLFIQHFEHLFFIMSSANDKSLRNHGQGTFIFDGVCGVVLVSQKKITPDKRLGLTKQHVDSWKYPVH